MLDKKMEIAHFNMTMNILAADEMFYIVNFERGKKNCVRIFPQ